MRGRRLAVLGVCFSCLSTIAYGIQIKLSLQEVAQTADLVFVGTVARQASHANEKNTAIDTDVTFSDIRIVNQTPKSRQRDASGITLTYAGGTVGDVSFHVSDTPAFTDGRRYLIFMNDDGPRYMNPIVGGFQGLFEVVTDRVTGQEFLLTAAGRAVVGVDDAGNVKTTAQPVASIAAGVPAFRTSAAAIASADDPVAVSQGASTPARIEEPSAAQSLPLMSLEAFITHVTTVSLKQQIEKPLIVREGVGKFYREIDGRMVGEPIKETALHVANLDKLSARRAPPIALGTPSLRPDEPMGGPLAPWIEPLGASLVYCGRRWSWPFSMEQVSTSWWEWSVNNNTMWTWNNYVDLFRYIPDDGSFSGGNGVSEFDGYPSSATLSSQYGYTWGGSTLAVTFTYTIFGSCGYITESDVAWNPARSWTDNYLFAFNNSSVVNQYPVTLHELGHTVGLQRGAESYDYDYPSAMHAYYYNVAEDGWGAHLLDSANLRADYGSSTGIADIGVESYYASNGLNNAWLSSSFFHPGNGITANSMTVENQSQFSLADVHIRLYLSTNQTISTGDRLIGDWSWSSFCGVCEWVGALSTSVPYNTPPGSYWLGALMTINGYGGDGYSGNDATFFTTPITVSCSGMFSSSPSSRSVLKTGINSSFALNTLGSACPWTAVSSDSAWLHVTSSTSGTGAATISYTADANTTASPRSATISAGGAFHTVSQEAGCVVAAATPINIWGVASGSISTGDCLSALRSSGGLRPYADRYSFSGTAGQQVAIGLSGGGVLDTYLFLVGPLGAIVAQDDDGGNGADSRIPAASGTFTLPTTGTYVVEVTTFGMGTTGAYTLRVMSSITMAVAPDPVSGSCKVSKGKITLGAIAPAGGVVLAMSDTLASASTPATFTIPAGAVTKSVTINTTAVASSQTGNVTAGWGGIDGVSGSDSLTVRPIWVSTNVVSPTSVVGGSTATGTVTLECSAAPGNITVNLTSTKPSAAMPAVSSITIPFGASTGTFTINTFAVAASTTATIKASANGGNAKGAKLTINP